MKLEASLASSTSREDLLRKELADAARREGVAQEKHARGLSEVGQRAAGVGGERKEEGDIRRRAGLGGLQPDRRARMVSDM